MTHKNAIVTLMLFSYAATSTLIDAAVTLKGDDAAGANQTFSFPVQQKIQAMRDQSIRDQPMRNQSASAQCYVGAHPASGGANNVNEFAVSTISPGGMSFMPIAPETVVLNGVQDQTNPLFDRGIQFLKLIEGNTSVAGSIERPVVVTANDLQTIYLINRFFGSATEVRSAMNSTSAAQNVPDAAGTVAGAIVGLEAIDPMAFAAVHPSGGTFGDTNSGIATALLGFDASANTGGGFFDIIDGPTGVLVRPGGNRAVPLDRTSSQIAIANPVAALENVVDMYWDQYVKRLYIAVQLTSGANAGDGGKAIVMGRVNANNVLELLSIGPDVLFGGSQDKIVGAVGSGSQVSIHRVRSMRTSNSLNYLIVQGGNGSPTTTRRSVFALPLVSGQLNGNQDSAINGTIANKNSCPVAAFSNSIFINRHFNEPATQVAEMTLSTDLPAQVGCGQLAAGPIADLFTRGDTVFVTVEDPDQGQQPGIFYSQAIHNEKGMIKGWTVWKRAVGTTDRVLAAGLDPQHGNFTFFSGDGIVGQAQRIKRTEWGAGDEDGLELLVGHINSEFPVEVGGVQSFKSFSCGDAPFGHPGTSGAFVTATGLNKVILAQTGSLTNGVCLPVGGTNLSDIIRFEDGRITQNFPVGLTRVISISGGVLEEIGPVQTSEIATGGNVGWLFVGGTGGLAVLSHEDGDGWNPAANQLGEGFAGLAGDMSFKMVGEYTHVRKLIHDGLFLYVLTDTKLDRIDLTQGAPGLGQVAAVTVATHEGVLGVSARGTFLDVVVSSKLALLGTSAGLYRVGNGQDITLATNTSDPDWTRIALPEGVEVARQIVPVSFTCREQDFARSVVIPGNPQQEEEDRTVDVGGHVYVLDSYRGTDRARIHRFAIQTVNATDISDLTVQPLPDQFIQNIPSYFASFGLFRNRFATDGALYFASRGQELLNAPILSIFPGHIDARGGVRFLGVQSIVAPLVLSPGDSINTITRNVISGSWVLAANSGIQVNE